MKNELFFMGSFGLERETLRVDSRGALAQTPHPFEESPNITRDFCENQVELVTPVCKSIEDAVGELRRLDGEVKARLELMDERLWLYSNPPHFESEDDIKIADFTGENAHKRSYREQLAKRYGKRLMLFSGVHFNFSFDDGYLRSICVADDFNSWRDSFYLRLYKQLSRYSWLILLLTAASPVYDRSLFEDGAKGYVLGKYASVRNSGRGYWNSFVPVLRTDSLQSFVESIEGYVKSGQLFSPAELYLPVRLKPKGENKLENLKNGVSHIELRMFDLDPTAPEGVDIPNLEFAHLLIMYLSSQPDFEFTAELQRQAVQDHKNAALYDLGGVYIDGVPILEKANGIINDMAVFFCGDNNAEHILRQAKNKLKNRLCERITEGRVCG